MRPRTSSTSVASIGVLFLVLFGILVVHLKRGETFWWDEPTLDRLHEQIPYAQKLVWPSVIVGPIVALVAIGFLIRKRRWRGAFAWGAAVGGVVALDPVLKELVARPALNPTSSGYSLPSGSAMVLLAATVALIASVPASRRPLAAAGGAAVILYQGAILVSIRWHYPSDVVAGWCVTISWLAVIWMAVSALADVRARPRAPADHTS